MTKLWNKDFTLSWVSNIFYALNFFTLMATIADYSVNKYGATPEIAGLCVSIFVLGSIVMRIVTGPLLVIIDRRKLLLIGGGMVLVSVLLYFVPIGLAGFLAVRTLNGMAWGMVCNLLNALVLDYIPEGRLGEGIGYYTMGNPLSNGIGPLIGIFIMTGLGAYVLFGFVTFTAVVGLALIPFIKIGILTDDGVPGKEKKSFGLGSLFEKKAMPLSLVTFITAVCYSSTPAFMQLYTAERGLAWIAPLYFVSYAAAVALTRPIAGKLQDRIGDNPVIIPAVASFGAGVLVLSYASSPWMFFVVAVLCGIGYGSFFSGFQAIVVGKAPPEKSGLAMSTIYIFADSGMGVGPYVWGLVVKISSFSRAFFISGLVVICAIGLYYIAHGRLASAKLKRK